MLKSEAPKAEVVEQKEEEAAEEISEKKEDVKVEEIKEVPEKIEPKEEAPKIEEKKVQPVKVEEEKSQAIKAKEEQVSEKSRLYALLLSFFFGWAGGHRFYVNKPGTALLMFFTMGGFGMWWDIDVIMILIGQFKDKEGLPLKKWQL